MRTRLHFVLIIFLIFVVNSCSPLVLTLFSEHWDIISDTLLTRSTSPYIDSPDAVVVWDLEDLNVVKAGWDIIREHHVRIQIFTEEGKKYANIRIPYMYTDKITQIKAQTILPDGRRIPLKPGDVFDEGFENIIMFKKFALPGVEDNCIIEYQYQSRTGSVGATLPKYFQSDLHTEYSKFKITLPGGFSYVANARNAPDDYVAPVEEKIHIPNDFLPTKTFSWEYSNLPPVKDEVYLFNREDHLFSIGLQLTRYVDQHIDVTFLKTWEDMNEILVEEYDSYLHPDREIGRYLKKIKSDTHSDTLSPRDIFKYVRDELNPRGYNSIFTRDISKVIKFNSASPTERNLLLTVLLREAGYDADPVIISRRSNGRISIASPTLMDFDHLIVRLKEQDKTTLLDASDKYSSFALMPADNFCGIGLVIAEGEANFIKFPYHGEQSKRTILTNCQLGSDGALTGNFNIHSTGHYASSLRKRFALATDTVQFAYAELVNHLPGIIIERVALEMNMNDYYLPVETQIFFQIPDYYADQGDMIYIPTNFYQNFKENELVDEERIHPIQFYTTFKINETVNFTLPDSCEIIEYPDDFLYRGPGQHFRKQIRPTRGAIQFAWQYQRDENIFDSEDYPALKDFFTNVIAADQAMLLLKF